MPYWRFSVLLSPDRSALRVFKVLRGAARFADVAGARLAPILQFVAAVTGHSAAFLALFPVV